MTTVLYHKGFMYADSLSSSQMSEEQSCMACGTHGVVVRKQARKIATDFKGVTFRGERVLAVGRAGLSALSTAMINIIRSGFEIDTFLTKVGSCGHDRRAGTCTLLMVTDQHVWKLLIEDHRVQVAPEVRMFELTDTVTIGSGGAAARLSLLIKDDPFMAMSAAAMADPSTGGTITHTGDLLNVPEGEMAKLTTGIAMDRELSYKFSLDDGTPKGKKKGKAKK